MSTTEGYEYRLIRYNTEIAQISQRASQNMVRLSRMIAASTAAGLISREKYVPIPLSNILIVVLGVMFFTGWIGVILNATQFERVVKIRRPVEPVRIEQTVPSTRIAICHERTTTVDKFGLEPVQWRARAKSKKSGWAVCPPRTHTRTHKEQ